MSYKKACFDTKPFISSTNVSSIRRNMDNKCVFLAQSLYLNVHACLRRASYAFHRQKYFRICKKVHLVNQDSEFTRVSVLQPVYSMCEMNLNTSFNLDSDQKQIISHCLTNYALDKTHLLLRNPQHIFLIVRLK